MRPDGRGAVAHLGDDAFDRLAVGDGSQEERWHVWVCADCRKRADAHRASEREDGRRLVALDHLPPRYDADTIVKRAGTRYGRRSRRVAALVGVAGTVLAAALAASVPATSIRRFVRATFRLPAGAAETRPVIDHGGGTVTVPVAGSATVVFRQPALIRITRAASPSPTLRVTRLTGATVRYLVAPWGVAVESADAAARFDVTLPASAARTRVVVGADTVFASDGARVTTTARDSGGRLIVDPPRSRVQH